VARRQESGGGAGVSSRRIAIAFGHAAMPKRLPYRVNTASGTVFDIEFPLHAETVSAEHVARLLSATLAQVDHELGVLGDTANGDVLQALAMALAVRARMLKGQSRVADALARDLLDAALGAAEIPPTYGGPVGHA
jgi:hypothetical protein